MMNTSENGMDANMNKALVKDNYYLIERKDKKTGFTERTIYTGTLRNKPSGWRVVGRI